MKSIEDNFKDCLKIVIISWNKRIERAISTVKHGINQQNIADFKNDLQLFGNVKNDLDTDYLFYKKYLVPNDGKEETVQFWKDIPSATSSQSLMGALTQVFQSLLNKCNLGLSSKDRIE